MITAAVNRRRSFCSSVTISRPDVQAWFYSRSRRNSSTIFPPVRTGTESTGPSSCLPP